MKVVSTEIPDVKILQPAMFPDDRGYFFESFNSRVFSSEIGPMEFVQDNESLSKKNVLRGLHYQSGGAAQSKLIRVVQGSVWDVAVDLRQSSKTFKRWVGVELSAQNKKQLLVPKGFAHGFLVLSDEAVVQYKVDSFYSKEADRGIRFDDPDIGIVWPSKSEALLSEKDRVLPLLSEAELFV